MISETIDFFKYVSDRAYFIPLEYNGLYAASVFSPQNRQKSRELATMFNQCYIVSKQGFLKSAAIISKGTLEREHGIHMTSLPGRNSEYVIIQSDFEMAIKKLVHHFGKRVVYKEIRTELLGSKQAVKILVDGMCLTDLLFIEDKMCDCRYTMRADDDAVTVYQHTTVMGGTFGFQVSKDLWQGILPLDGQLHQNLQQILHNNPRLLVSAERYLARQYGDSPSHHSSS